MAIVDKCSKLFENAEDRIFEVVENTTSDFKSATTEAKKMIGKNLLFSFVTSLILLAAAIGGYLYVQNYRDGTAIAKARADKVLSAERAKLLAEMDEEKIRLYEELHSNKNRIEQAAISTYKNSESYKEEACKLVAQNISKIQYVNYLYLYIKSEDLEKYSPLKDFYYLYLDLGYNEYKNKKKR